MCMPCLRGEGASGANGAAVTESEELVNLFFEKAAALTNKLDADAVLVVMWCTGEDGVPFLQTIASYEDEELTHSIVSGLHQSMHAGLAMEAGELTDLRQERTLRHMLDFLEEDEE